MLAITLQEQDKQKQCQRFRHISRPFPLLYYTECFVLLNQYVAGQWCEFGGHVERRRQCGSSQGFISCSSCHAAASHASHLAKTGRRVWERCRVSNASCLSRRSDRMAVWRWCINRMWPAVWEPINCHLPAWMPLPGQLCSVVADEHGIIRFSSPIKGNDKCVHQHTDLFE